MSDSRHTPETKAATAKLKLCPFCHGPAEFFINKSGQIMLAHYPANGVCCPARYEAYCDNFEQGLKWWNFRADSIDTCIVCGKQVSTGICKDCYEKELRKLLAEKGSTPPTKN